MAPRTPKISKEVIIKGAAKSSYLSDFVLGATEWDTLCGSVSGASFDDY